MNDLITPLVEYPAVYGFYYIVRIFWATFAILTFLRYVTVTRQVWRDLEWWEKVEDGLEINIKRIVAEDRFAMKIWLSIASVFIVASAVVAIKAILFDPLPQPDVAVSSVPTIIFLLMFIFCFYRAANVSRHTEAKLRKLVEIEQKKE